jgi:hypothetical protein
MDQQHAPALCNDMPLLLVGYDYIKHLQHLSTLRKPSNSLPLSLLNHKPEHFLKP